jgi:hypothetical protein
MDGPYLAPNNKRVEEDGPIIEFSEMETNPLFTIISKRK